MNKIDIEKLLIMLQGVRIFKADMLPHRTMYVSDDLFELFKSDDIINHYKIKK